MVRQCETVSTWLGGHCYQSNSDGTNGDGRYIQDERSSAVTSRLTRLVYLGLYWDFVVFTHP